MKPPILLPAKHFAGDPSFLERWAASQLPHVGARGFGPCQAVGVVKGSGASDARLLAVVVFHDWQPAARTVQISCASTSPMWAHPQTIRELLSIPFGKDYDCFKVWVAIPHTNERSIRFNRGMGMREEARIRHQFGQGTHAVIMGMTRPEWGKRWREAAHGQVQRAAAA